MPGDYADQGKHVPKRAWYDLGRWREARESRRDSPSIEIPGGIPDEQIATHISDLLSVHDELKNQAIAVTVDGGLATLGGHVSEAQLRTLAGDIAQSVVGVKEVHNNLRITRQ